MKSWPLVLATLMLLSAWGVIQSFSRGEAEMAKKAFVEFPLVLDGQWEGKELGMEDNILKVLKLTDYMMRVYSPVNTVKSLEAAKLAGETTTPDPATPQSGEAPVWLYVGYYKSQRTGATYHSPKNCLPGAGWQFVRSDYVTVPLQGTSGVTINQVLIQKGLDKQVILYWYQDRGRVIASEYWAKAYMIWDAITMNRTDGSLVRISIPVINSPDEALAQGLGFLKDLWPTLLDYMPDSSVKAT